ncbi:hypothetical protein DFH06DRAFT_1145103 [Mycena polygramma]|nr:hypothetical protein DFH06DRAFT_1145103 [Mycena polygramma]
MTTKSKGSLILCPLSARTRARVSEIPDFHLVVWTSIIRHSKQAPVKLEETAVASKERLKERAQDNVQHLSDSLRLENVFVTDTGRQHKTWRLCTVQDDDDAVDEVIFRMQGVVSKNELVPRSIHRQGYYLLEWSATHKLRCTSAKAIFLSQHIEICGLKTKSFEDAVKNLFNIHQKFAQHIAGVPFSDLVTRDSPDGPYLSANNRIFTHRSDAPTEQDNLFEEGLDAVGRLAKLKGTDLIHAPENIVKYFRISTGTDGGHYVREVPGAFKVGDLVEIQLSFVAMMSHKTVKVTNRLQALTLLDESFSRSAIDIRLSAIAVQPSVQVGIRRKIGYFKEDDEEVRVFKKKNTGTP